MRNPITITHNYINELIRLPKDVLDEISWIPQHPDEIFNTTMFTLIFIKKALMEWNREDKESVVFD